MKLKWTEIMKAFHKAEFTDKEYGLIHCYSDLDETIGVEEYSIGEQLYEALTALGIDIELDF